MKWLNRLKKPKAPDHHATETTKITQGTTSSVFVGFVAYPLASFQKIEGSEATNDTTPTADPDRWCWPHSESLNGQEIDTFTARLARFTDMGLTPADAEREADRLVIRDREGDDRRLCLECVHLHGVGRWRCGNWRKAGVCLRSSDAGLARDLVLILQRCDGFKATTP